MKNTAKKSSKSAAISDSHPRPSPFPSSPTLSSVIPDLIGDLFQYTINHRIDVLLTLIRMNVEIRISGKHSRKLCLGPVVEYMTGLSELLGIRQFIAYAQ